MAIVLALGAAAFYGSADFMGGLASRRASALRVALGSQLAGLAVLAVGLVVVGSTTVTGLDLLAGAASGVFGALGLVTVFRALAVGPMSVVAPTTALSAASVPVLAGVVLGERPGMTALLGIVVAFVAVGLITWERTEPGVPRAVGRTVLLAALAGGTVFGLFFVFQHQAGAGAGIWPLLAARAVSIPFLAALVRREGPSPSGARSISGPVLLSGTLDMAANILFVLATRHGMLSVVSALTGLYPASTVLLAQGRLGERMQETQVLGLGVASIAAVLVAV